ncbi:MAG: hypothetical protein B7X39_18730 [Lysobacterales bacterium 14-68-21]|jgi:hypothetical protein|nr:MAG: hypothetical protein B7X45_16695 [Xanthomonadales bacterium 15-68-25]OZB63711.1 MAG: hypothetical protein B7X39_18730 [Xanthomonadales bacterium 14-68-21]
MRLVLNDEDDIPIPLDDPIHEAWLLQYDRALHSGSIESFQARLAQCFAVSLIECLDVDLKPPTAAQVKYATDIARQLGIPLPYEVLRFRGSMGEFIDRFAEVFRQKRRGNLQG